MRIRTTFYFDTGREQSSHDCDSVEEAFDRLQRYNMDATAFPVGTLHGAYIWRPRADNTLEAFSKRMTELGAK